MTRGTSDFTWFANGDVDIVCLEHTTEIGLVGFTLAQTLEGSFLVPEGLKKGIGEFHRVKGSLR